MDQLFLSLTAAIFIGGAAGFLGTLMFSKKMALAAGPLGHLTLPGIAIARVYGFDISIGAFPFVFLGAVLIWFLEVKTKLPMEALTAVVFASGVAFSFLFLPIDQAETALVGDITKVSGNEVLFSVILSVVVLLVTKKIYSKITLINISEDMAKAEGVNIKRYNFLYLLSVATIVALGVKVVGGLLTAALVAIPVCTSRNLSNNLSQYLFYSVFFGIISAFFGILLFKATGFLAGPLIIIINTLFFLLSIFIKTIRERKGILS